MFALHEHTFNYYARVSAMLCFQNARLRGDFLNIIQKFCQGFCALVFFA